MTTNNIIDFTTIEDAIAEAFQVYAMTLIECKGMIYIYMNKETNEINYSLKDTFKNKDCYLYLCAFTRYQPSSNTYDNFNWDSFKDYYYGLYGEWLTLSDEELDDIWADDYYDEAKENLKHNNYLPAYYTFL